LTSRGKLFTFVVNFLQKRDNRTMAKNTAQIRVDKDLYDQVKKLADKENRLIVTVFNSLIEEALKARGSIIS
jgi:hypothetical protein